MDNAMLEINHMLITNLPWMRAHVIIKSSHVQGPLQVHPYTVWSHFCSYYFPKGNGYHATGYEGCN